MGQQFQQYRLFGFYAQSGTAALPIGAIVRDGATGQWAFDLVPVDTAETWRERLSTQRVDHPLSEEVLEQWLASANGITWGIASFPAIETATLALAKVYACDAALGEYMIVSEEV